MKIKYFDIFILYLIGVGMVAAPIAIILATVYRNRNNVCVINTPREIVSMVTTQRSCCLCDTSPVYTISYVGTKQKTKKQCTISLTVTQDQYESVLP